MNFNRVNPYWNFRSISRILIGLASTIGVGLLLTGCGSGTTVTGSSLVRVFNAYVPAPGADSTITVMSNGTSLTGGANALFGDLANSGTYVSVPSGKFTASAQPTGTSGLEK